MLQEVHGGVLVGFAEVLGEGCLGELEVEVAVLVLALSAFLEGDIALLDFVVDVLDVRALLAQPAVGSVHLLAGMGVDLVLNSQQR